MALSGGQVARDIDRLGLTYGPDEKDFIESALHRNWRKEPICKPLAGVIRAQYGQAQFAPIIDIVRDWQKYPPYAAAPRKAAK